MSIEFTKEESEYLQHCMALGTTVATGLPIPNVFAEKIYQWIASGVHRTTLEKLAPERAAKVEEMMNACRARGETLQDTEARIADLINSVQAEQKKNAH